MSDQITLDKKQGIYVDLDALLDTRLSTIIDVAGEDVALQVLSNGYFTRKSDIFPGVDKTAFDTAYKNRTKGTLVNATVTKVMRLVTELVQNMNKQAIATPMHAGPKIVINTYPYVLTEDELSFIIRGVAASSNKACDVVSIRVPPSGLTPKYCQESFAVMFKYNYAEWFELQAAAFEKTRCAELTCIVPAIYFVKEPTAEELENLVRKDMHPLSAIEMLSSVFIDLKLYDIETFCANVANNITELKSYKGA